MDYFDMTPFFAMGLAVVGLMVGGYLFSPRSPLSRWLDARMDVFARGLLFGLALGALLFQARAVWQDWGLVGFFAGAVGRMTGAWDHARDLWKLFFCPGRFPC